MDDGGHISSSYHGFQSNPGSVLPSLFFLLVTLEPVHLVWLESGCSFLRLFHGLQ